MNTQRSIRSVPPDAVIQVEHDRQWIVLVIEHPRRTGRVYLKLDEAARVVAVFQAELPEVRISKGGTP